MNTRYVDPVGPGCTGALAAANYYGTKVKK